MRKSYTSRRSMALTMPMILAAVTASGSAQDANSAEDDIEDFEEIVVTGIRGALKSARDVKRNADTALDSITASDVGALPDLSVAEALGRVPGVTVQRVTLGGDGGDFPSPEGGGNLIRGLTLVRSELNGRDAFTANNGRALDFGTIPPELIGAVEVFKNTTADLIQGGIGGTINLRTLEPFDREGAFATVTLDGTYTDMRDEWAPDFSITAGNRWDVSSGEFGLLASYSNSELKSDLNGFQIGQLYPNPVDPAADIFDPDVERVAVPGGWQLRTNDVDRKRESYYAAMQWRDEEGRIEVTAKYARIENEIISDERTLETFGSCERWFLQRPADGGPISAGSSNFSSAGLPICNGIDGPAEADSFFAEQTFPVNGLFEGGVLTNPNRSWTGATGAEIELLGIHREERSTTDDLSLNIEWQPTDRLFVNLDAHITTADAQLQLLRAGTGTFSDYAFNPDLDNPSVRLVPRTDNNPWRITDDLACGVDWSGLPDCGAFGPTTADLADPDNTFARYAADEFRDNEGDLVSFKADIQYDFDDDGWFDSVKFGARYAKREQLNRQAGLNWAQLAPAWGGGFHGMLSGFQADVAGTEDFSDFFRGGVVEGTPVAYFDADLVADYDAFVAAVAQDPIVVGGWQPLRVDGVVDYEADGVIGDIAEKNFDAYFRLNFGNEFDNGMAFSGNLGLRYTKSTVDGTGEIDFVRAYAEAQTVFFPETDAFFSQPSIDRSGRLSESDYWMPSVNLKWELDDQQMFRFAVSKAITPPNVGELYSAASWIPAFTFITDDVSNLITDVIPNTINVYGGNPDLKAIEAWNFDMSYEYYFGEQDSFTVSLFKKDISNNIVYGTTTIDVLELDGNQVPVVFNGQLNQDKADLKGFEVAYQQFYDFLPGIWGNLGLQANYTYIDSSANPPAPTDDRQSLVGGEQVVRGLTDPFLRIYRYGVDNFLGLSKHTANVVGIYQDEKLELRLAYNWRSEHLSSYRDFITGNPIFQSPRGYLDASIKYNFTEQLQFRVQIANITNTVAKAEQQIDQAGQRFGRSAFMGDRRIKAGFRYNF